jgi:hypothetical protein
MQAIGHLARGGADAVAADTVHFKRDDVALAFNPCAGGFPEYSLEQFFYHQEPAKNFRHSGVALLEQNGKSATDGHGYSRMQDAIK